VHTLSNFTILEYAKLTHLPIDCLPKDMMPKVIKKNTGIIANLNNLGENGSHWVCIIRKNNKILYYDPFGVIHIPKEIEKAILNSVNEKNIFVSNGQNQHLISILCGYYCLKICKSILLDNMTFLESINQFTDEPSDKNADIADNLFI